MQRAARRGFTLVEMLMVIVIIALLAGLLTVAVNRAMTGANQARITSEIAQLDTAMQNFATNNGGTYPPCLANADPSTGNPDLNGRANRLLTYLRRAFPRYTQVAPGQPLTYQNLNTVTQQRFGLSIDKLDQAEALVFWLGGIPATQLVPNSSKLWGFSSNPQDPFQVEQVGGQWQVRSPSKGSFTFDESRLVDVDGDGWWEYSSPGKATIGDFMAPYVYFDAGTYNSPHAGQFSACLSYPSPSGLGPGNMAGQWGVAVPYRQLSNTALGWVNPKKFQIVSAGLDSIYGLQQSYSTLRQPLYPSGFHPNPSNPSASPNMYYGEGELDNLTNFTKRTLEDAKDGGEI